jgi:hypothetical protein
MSAIDCVFRPFCTDQSVCAECCHLPGCVVCGAKDALAQCDWPEWRFVTARYGQLKVGDRVKRAIERLKHRAPATVARVEAGTESAHGLLNIELAIQGRSKFIQVRPSSPVMVERPTVCRAVVCELHRADRGPSGLVCMHHWHAWEAVA